jgi:hypothetical protein
MQSRHDKRRSSEELRPEYAYTNNYFGTLIDRTAEDYAPYAANWLLFGKGNHESSVELHTGIDLTTQLRERMRGLGSNAVVGAYDGWILFRFVIQSTVIQTWRLRYYHGAGAAAPVTKGMIEAQRQAVYLPDADIVLNGHNHDDYITASARERCSQGAKVWQDLIWFVRTPGYKWRGQWERERGHSPKPHGCAWLRFYLNPHTSMVWFDLSMDLR